MLGKTAGGLYWMFRYLERSDNTARLLEAGFRMALTRSSDAASEWESVVTTSGTLPAFHANYGEFSDRSVIDHLLRSPDNSSSVLSVTKSARDNARLVRTALTTEVWEAVNDNWMTLRDLLALRDPLYREIADLVVETDERPPRMVVLDILERLQRLPPR